MSTKKRNQKNKNQNYKFDALFQYIKNDFFIYINSTEKNRFYIKIKFLGSIGLNYVLLKSSDNNKFIIDFIFGSLKRGIHTFSING